jgi:hypothetical protein
MRGDSKASLLMEAADDHEIMSTATEKSSKVEEDEGAPDMSPQSRLRARSTETHSCNAHHNKSQTLPFNRV